MDQSFAPRSDAFPEKSEFGSDGDAPIVVTPESLLRHIDRIRANAELDRSHANALRSVAMMAQFGLPAAGKKEEEAERDRFPTLAELHGRTEDGQLIEKT